MSSYDNKSTITWSQAFLNNVAPVFCLFDEKVHEKDSLTTMWLQAVTVNLSIPKRPNFAYENLVYSVALLSIPIYRFTF